MQCQILAKACKMHRHCALKQWKDVLWRDELWVTIWQSDGSFWDGKMLEEHYLPQCIVPTEKFGGGGIMVWGCFSGFGLCPLVRMKGNTNATVYKHIFKNCILPNV